MGRVSVRPLSYLVVETSAEAQRMMRTDPISNSQIKPLTSPRRINECAECLDTCCVGKKSTVLLTRISRRSSMEGAPIS